MTAAPVPPGGPSIPPVSPEEAFARAGEAITRARDQVSATVAEAPTVPPVAAAPAAPAPAAPAPTAPAPTVPADAAPVAAPAPGRPSPPHVPGRPPVDRETSLHEAAVRLAGELRAIPGIERFGAIRLADLERAGPRPLRVLWRIARDQLDERFGQLTIGEVIERYGGGRTH